MKSTAMGPMLFTVWFVAFLSFSVADYDMMGSPSKRCNTECDRETLECSANCRMEDVLDKREVMGCLRECKLQTATCENTCTCLTNCTTRMKDCDKRCRAHPFQNSHDRRECQAECSYEAEQCGNKCKL